jgi:ethanolamine-phosphate cytidylyltransferase
LEHSDAAARMSAVEACRWATKPIGDAPYVTHMDFIDQYDCKYVVHGDDITSDSNGEDCYRFVKAAGRFLVVRRTPGISTTDLVGRMLLCTRNHFIKSLTNVLDGLEGPGSDEERKASGRQMKQRMRDYATNQTGLQAGAEVYGWSASADAKGQDSANEAGTFDKMVDGIGPRAGQRVVYVDGGFDLFSSGHIEFLRQVVGAERALGESNGWYTDEAREQRVNETGDDYPPAFIVAGIHDDEVINYWKGVNYPIMNIFERGLCVLQCKAR